MSKLLDFLKPGPSAPPVVLLPDDRFFIRVLPVPAEAAAGDVANAVDIALETISPFPPNQLYYGYYWEPGSDHALVFACYRKRFGSDQTSAWAGSQIVLPTFASVLGLKPGPATTVLIPSFELLTAVHWGTGPVPNAVITRTLAPDATDEDRARVRDELLRAVGESTKVIALPGPPDGALSADEKNFVFQSGDISAELPIDASEQLDVRDKGELETLRRSKGRDVLMWRVFIGCAAALVVLGLFEVGIAAGRKYWISSLSTVIAKQAPTVESIQGADQLATFIQNLNTKLVLPFEMVSAIHPANPQIASPRVTFTRVSVNASSIYELIVNASAASAEDLSAYISKLRVQPSVANVVPGAINAGGRGGTATAPITVIFKPDALKPSA